MNRSKLVSAVMAASLSLASALPAWSQAAPTTDVLSAPETEAEIYSSKRHDEARRCDDRDILSRIVSKFRHQVKHVPHLPQVAIVDFRRIHQHRNYVANDQWPIPRRYCGATVALSDGGNRDIWYLIEGGMGFATLGGDGVEFCISGFDRWYVYNGRCRVLR